MFCFVLFCLVIKGGRRNETQTRTSEKDQESREEERGKKERARYMNQERSITHLGSRRRDAMFECPREEEK